MANVTITLETGLTIGAVQHLEAELRELTAGDIFQATAESEKLVDVPGDGPQMLTSPTLVGINSLRRQIVRIGEHQGPLTLEELGKLSVIDVSLLQEAAQKMEVASLEVAMRGRY